MWTHPGKKLLFMGGEIGQIGEWSHDGEVTWSLLDDPGHAALQRLIGDLNRLYVDAPQLHATDCEPTGFNWTVGDDAANSVFVYARRAPDHDPLIVAINMTPVPRHNYRIGAPLAGRWREILNTDSRLYGGSDAGNGGRVETEAIASHGQAQSLELVLPPLAAIISAARELIMRTMPDRLEPGAPYPLGATWDGLGVNFAVFSANATRIELCIFDARGTREIARFDLPEHTDEIWHGYMPDAMPGLVYGFRAYGPYEPQQRPPLQSATSCCSIPMPRALPASFAGRTRCSATACALRASI